VIGPRIALATAARLPAGVEDTAPLVLALAAEGCESRPVIWSDRSVDWGDYDLVVLHSPWDYTSHVADFLSWVDEVEKASRLPNPAALVRWNADKRYLLDLAAAGLAMAPSLVLDRGCDANEDLIAERFGQQEELVVKPRVGAGGRRVLRVPAPDVATVARSEMPDEPCLIQSFQSAVLSSGELSAVCADGQLTHVVRKTVGGQEFRIHERYGGQTTPVSTEPWMIGFAEQVLAALPATAQIARVDFTVAEDGTPTLMEVEVIEPDLFLRMSPAGLARVAAALSRTARGS
jgi:glutathione synthase/RimK-type ligase-like ATP-grasp enzyme